MQKIAQQLEFEKIIERLCNYPTTPLGLEEAKRLEPLHDPQKIAELQAETTEGLKALQRGKLTINACQDILQYVKRARKGSLLTAAELREVGDFLKTIHQLKPAFLKEEGVEEVYPRLWRKVSALTVLPQVVAAIDQAISPHGEVRDQATPLLSSLKKQGRALQEKIRKTLDSYVQSPGYGKYLQDRIITVRQNRYVLPLKQEFRHHIPGVVHDQSSSGMTLFVEPFPVLELNNKLREVDGKVEEEIERILRKLTFFISAHDQDLENNYYGYAELDFIMARGYLSQSYRGMEPTMDPAGNLEIFQGRHPLIPEHEVVPIDVRIGKDFKTLVITGPNTGGKTVTLKTIGLFALMFQSGLHLPAEAGTSMGVYQAVMADIGDEQDIEQSLSTFSGHMSNIIPIIHGLEKQRGPLLILLDELGAGTDPQEGSALAMAILDYLHLFDTRTIATTHINDLKVFAHMRAGMENASMEFDPHSLAPTFRLLIGIPGQSNALIIARQLGLSENLVEKARSFMKKEFLDLEQAVSGLVEERKKMSVDAQTLEDKKRLLEKRLEDSAKQWAELKSKRKEYLNQARQEAKAILREAQVKASEALRSIQLAEKEKEKKKHSSMIEASRRQLKALHDQLDVSLQREDRETAEYDPVNFEELEKGSPVFIKSLRTRGEVIRLASAEDIQVQVGALKINTTLEDLGMEKTAGTKLANEKDPGPGKTSEKSGAGALLWQKCASTKPHVDLRGLTLEEALSQLEKYLDDSLLAGLDAVVIIHGKGTGRLRQGIHQHLESWGRSGHYRLGEEDEGGSGVTVVTLRQDAHDR